MKKIFTVCLAIQFQPILAKRFYDIYKFQIFKKITIFHNILNIRQLCV